MFCFLFFYYYTRLLLGHWLQTFIFTSLLLCFWVSGTRNVAVLALGSLAPRLFVCLFVCLTFILLGHSLQNFTLLLVGYWLQNFTFAFFNCFHVSNIAAVLHLLTKPQLRMDRFRV